MSEQPRSGRLGAETLAAYVDGQLPPEERARVEAEIAADPESYEWVVNAIRVAEELDAAGEGPAGSGSAGAVSSVGQGASANTTPVRHSAPASKPTPTLVPDPDGAMTSEPVSAPAPRPASVIPFYKRRSVHVGIGALLATAAALVLAVQLEPARRLMPFRAAYQGVDDGDPHFAKLVAAVGEERYIEGRLTGGFEYQVPCVRSRAGRATCPVRTSRSWRRRGSCRRQRRRIRLRRTCTHGVLRSCCWTTRNHLTDRFRPSPPPSRYPEVRKSEAIWQPRTSSGFEPLVSWATFVKPWRSPSGLLRRIPAFGPLPSIAPSLSSWGELSPMRCRRGSPTPAWKNRTSGRQRPPDG